MNYKTYRYVGYVAVFLVFGGMMYNKCRKLLKQFFASQCSDIHLCTTINHWRSVEKEFLKCCSDSKIIGLDCEWVTSKRRHPVSLLQLATSNGNCVLLRLNLISLPQNLLDMIADNKILKVGVGIAEDSAKLFQDHGIIVRGYLDLRYVISTIYKDHNVTKLGLKNLARTMLGIEINETMRCSNWEASVLNPIQINYAAQDAIVAAQIFEKAMKYKICKGWFLGSTAEEIAVESQFLFHYYINIPFKQRGRSNSLKMTPSIRKRDYSRAYITLKKPLYHNCKILAPDGQQLCTCDVKKAQWYLDKELAEKVSTTPLIVKLNFEPSGRPILDNIYYIQEKSNHCVVCGNSESYIRKNIVPHEYQKYFPSIMKNHLSHDIVLLCIDCHKRSNNFDFMLRQKLADECNAPLEADNNIKLKENSALVKVKSAGRALLFNFHKIPEERRTELISIVNQYYEVEQLTDEIILKAAELETRKLNEQYVCHGKKVIDYYSTNEGLVALEVKWRQHFIDMMQPKYLSKMWSVSHNHERLALQIANGSAKVDADMIGITEQKIEEMLQRISQNDSEHHPVKTSLHKFAISGSDISCK